MHKASKENHFSFLIMTNCIIFQLCDAIINDFDRIQNILATNLFLSVLCVMSLFSSQSCFPSKVLKITRITLIF